VRGRRGETSIRIVDRVATDGKVRGGRVSKVPEDAFAKMKAFYESPQARKELEDSVVAEAARGRHATEIAYGAAITKAEVRDICKRRGIRLREYQHRDKRCHLPKQPKLREREIARRAKISEARKAARRSES
jgi:hypothetical protein